MSSVLKARVFVLARAAGWQRAIAVLGMAVVVLLAGFWQTIRSLWQAWAGDGTYQYAFLIFPLSLWVALTLRHELMARPIKPSVWGLTMVGALVLVWWTGHRLDINLAQHFAFVAMFPALVLACWGWRALWVLAFPLGYLVIFAVPWGDGLVGPLQDFTAHFAVHALELTGIPVLLNGREILTPTATWMVEDACSGVKFFAACSALGCLYAYLMYQYMWKRVAFVVLSAVVPVLANGIRVYLTVLIGETWGLKYASGTDHMVFGWQFFGAVLLLLLLLGWFFRDPPMARQAPAEGGGQMAGWRVALWPAAMVLLIAGPLLATGKARSMPPVGTSLTAPSVAGWSVVGAGADGWQPMFRGASKWIHVAYRSASSGRVVGFFHAAYLGQPQRGHNLITFGNRLYDPAQGQVLSQSARSLQLTQGQRIKLGELWLKGDTGARLVWFRYCVNQRCTRSPVLAKLLQAWIVLRGQPPRSSVWAWSTVITHDDAEQARRDLAQFAHALPRRDLLPPADAGERP
ncbi:exosortase A [Oleiagrimonas sp. C23AA]|uniref:exosortase A n=1 Tax=Oleiagrimonas sp. C23AA TaxID=2719047 RepID=UPI0031B715D9